MKIYENVNGPLTGNWTDKSNGDIISGLKRHLAVEFTFSQNTRKSSLVEQMPMAHL
jgi:hypothetical protein